MKIIREVVRGREIIWTMAGRQVSERYAGTLGGFLWEIFHPLAMVGIFWFVFAIGFKAKGPGGMPFILYFISGMLPWIFFSSVLGGGVAAITSHAHLVKKTIFPTEILPFVYLLSTSVTHLVLLLIAVVVMVIYGWPFSLALLQLPYYFFAMCYLLMGLVWLTSALNAFNRDVGQVVRVVIDLWFWATPVVWVADLMPRSLQWIFGWNPMYYIVHGYRDSLLFGKPFWLDGSPAVIFWIGSTLLCLLGAVVFGRLKPQFADVL